MSVRPATSTDLGAIRAVSLAAGQPERDSGADAGYVRHLVATGTVLVALGADGGIVGWGAVRSGPLGSFLSDLFVDPAAHGSGVGSRLLRELWPGGPEAPARATFSSQHPSALPLYARAGLSPIWPLLYLQGRAADLPVSTLTVHEVTAVEGAVAEHRLVGPDRSADYTYWTRSESSTGLVVENGTGLVGAGALRPGELMHLVCDGGTDAAAVLFAAVAWFAGGPVSLCLPGPHPALVPLLRAGLRVVDYDLAMSTPDLTLPVSWVYSPGLA